MAARASVVALAVKALLVRWLVMVAQVSPTQMTGSLARVLLSRLSLMCHSVMCLLWLMSRITGFGGPLGGHGNKGNNAFPAYVVPIPTPVGEHSKHTTRTTAVLLLFAHPTNVQLCLDVAFTLLHCCRRSCECTNSSGHTSANCCANSSR